MRYSNWLVVSNGQVRGTHSTWVGASWQALCINAFGGLGGFAYVLRGD